MKLISEDLDIIKALEEAEPGKWLEGRELKFLEVSNNKISLKNGDSYFIKEDPEMLLRIIRLSGEIVMDIDEPTMEILKDNSDLLKLIPRNEIRDHFMGIIASNDAEKAMKYARDAGSLNFFYGDSTYRTASRRSHEEINTVIDNLNKARPEIEHRLTLLLKPLGKDGAINVLNHLIYNKEEGVKIVQAIKTVDKLYFLNTKIELKKFIKKYGYENYVFIDKISRQEKKIFDRQDFKIASRHYMLQEVETYKEPLRTEELAIDADKLINEGIVKNREDADQMLDMLLDTLLIKPRLNTEEGLLKKARQLKRNPFARHGRKVWWRR